MRHSSCIHPISKLRNTHRHITNYKLPSTHTHTHTHVHASMRTYNYKHTNSWILPVNILRYNMIKYDMYNYFKVYRCYNFLPGLQLSDFLHIGYKRGSSDSISLWKDGIMIGYWHLEDQSQTPQRPVAKSLRLCDWSQVAKSICLYLPPPPPPPHPPHPFVPPNSY